MSCIAVMLSAESDLTVTAQWQQLSDGFVEVNVSATEALMELDILFSHLKIIVPRTFSEP